MVPSYSFSSSLAFQPFKTPQSPISFPFARFRILTCTSEVDAPKPKPKLTPDRQKACTKSRRKSSYGTSRRSILKKSFSQEQVNFTAPVSDDPVVGIIGGGMSGIICAMYLEKRGVRSTVFDTGIHGLGGRMGTRVIDPQPLIFDHAAQFFTANDRRFSELLDDWLEKGLVQEWQGTIGELHNGGHFIPFPPSPSRYIGTKGMRPLAHSLLSETNMVSVVRPCWVSKLEPCNGMWHLSENGKPCGKFDAIVIAHNGKCANRLLMSSGLPLVAKQMKRLELSSIWALLAAFDDPLRLPGSTAAIPFEGAFVKGVDSLSWMGNNTKKLLKSQSGGPHCWTFFSTAAYGKQNKVPQENIPAATATRVKTGMLEGVEAALGLSRGSLQKPFYTRLQLWGAALPTNTLGIPCIFDPYGRTGVCGDWLLGSSIEAAALSGMAMANHIADYFQHAGVHPSEFAIGLEQEFEPLLGHDIGQFPGLEAQDRANEVEMHLLVK
ncbi:hypothetical protein QN277_014227 [Acacia crassicarpa]|uniref:FAD/NAD(P)-binding oxidoreductase family protein n=1 Tax=Acacia crassicarpa TaxID=499986 RepID=A0AAE1TFA1_9FABA|nr:hypothetical protein QN277_014227 [Acacia crassicarpa]